MIISKCNVLILTLVDSYLDVANCSVGCAVTGMKLQIISSVPSHPCSSFFSFRLLKADLQNVSVLSVLVHMFEEAAILFECNFIGIVNR